MPLSPSVIQTLDDLLDKNDHVVGYSEGERPELRDGQPTGRTGIRVYVDDLSSDLRLPDQIEGQPVFAAHGGRPRKKHGDVAVEVQVDPTTKVRPLIGGLSISDPDPDDLTGTLGYFVKRGNDVCVLTSNHILPNEHDDAIQPGTADGGTGADVVAKVTRSVDDKDLGVDAAAATIASGVGHTLTINDDIGKVQGQSVPSKDDIVRKSGAVTRLTSGKVLDVDVTIDCDGRYRHQIVVEGQGKPFSKEGDSGSLVVAADNSAVGLLMGGDDSQDYVNPIAAVLSALGATLA